jgi:hypothetical protein
MLNAMKSVLALLAISLALPNGAWGQLEMEPADKEFSAWIIGIDAGYFQPLGSWTDHRYARGVDLFQGSVAFNVDLERRMRRVGIALNAGYTKLNAGAWEDYAAAKGDRIESSASLIHFSALLRPYLKTSKPDVVNLELGVLYLIPQSQERFANRSYDYDFLKRGFGFIAGLRYEHYLNRTTALALRTSGVFAPSGVQYADGEKHLLSGLPITLGFRFEL